MTAHPCLLLGQPHRPEFAAIRSAVEQLASAGTLALFSADSISSALARCREQDREPELAIVLQEFPGQFLRGDVEQLLAAFPLCRWVCAVGRWCESERRHGSNWPEALLVPARLATHRLQQELATLAGTSPPLPLTAGRDEVFAADSIPPTERFTTDTEDASLTARVISADHQFRGYVAEVLAGAGFQCECRLPGEVCSPADLAADLAVAAESTETPAAASQPLWVVDLDPAGTWSFPAADCGPVLGLMAQPGPGDDQQGFDTERTCLLPKLTPPAALRAAARRLAEAS